ncbi:tRNA pseudouridine55 synthase [Kribbella sp. VKM Ac-2527]|uniref:tRNA pseudouridine synthase B n=1 Tax=Kribbella caucasensis TaxID=2512215 RepID=A0A4R6KI27_9ACTN|nr:tRNA pseudouridine(55) synthase TruB [Kribbella sp. VKM Ac-2527]TDO49902.1 tRNA pseudouridine55 synthase [Kribbella sp. VKM Ac-2527]
MTPTTSNQNGADLGADRPEAERPEAERPEATGADVTGAEVTGADVAGAEVAGADVAAAEVTQAEGTRPELARGGVVVADGIVIVDKPAGLTSHTVVARIRKLAGTRKVGHAGTLDPMATGVLVVGLNRATRLLGHLQLADKSYDATILLGATTSTDDAEGDILDVAPADAIAGITAEAIEAAVAGFRGEISQVPSKVSAIKVNGRRAYERVRAGEEVALKARSVTVSRYEITDVRPRPAEAHAHPAATPAAGIEVDISVDCSSGTYIRALARDLGAELGVGGHLTMLRRTRVGTFDIKSAHTLEEFADDFTWLPIADVAADTFPRYDADADQSAAIRTGRPLPGLKLPAGQTAMFAPDGTFLALYEPHGPLAKPTAVFVT